MGQAKNRGNRDQRMAAAMGLRKGTVAELREELGLPEGAEYLGYAVHLEKSDEFLAEFSDTAVAVRKVWAKTPELALWFSSFSDAIDATRQCSGSVVVVMFDVGSQIVVSGITGVQVVK